MEYKIVVFMPIPEKEDIKNAMFSEGAGVIGQYSGCAFESPGLGQYFPEPGTSPYIGMAGKAEVVEEVRVEMVCSKEKLTQVIEAMKKAHPYEEPAFDIYQLISP